MSDLKDQLLDRVNLLAKRVAAQTDPSAPMRSPSTRHMLADEIRKDMDELTACFTCLDLGQRR